MFINSTMTPVSFWNSVNILIKKFNVINKRLWGCKTMFSGYCKTEHSLWVLPKSCPNLGHEEDLQSYINTLFSKLQIELCDEPKSCYEVVIIELLPKQYTQKKAYQLVFLEKEKVAVTFYDITPEDHNQTLCPSFRYSLALENKAITLKTSLGLSLHILHS